MCDLRKLRTRLIVPGDDLVALVGDAIRGIARPGDVVAIAETAVAIAQSRFIPAEYIRPSWLARTLCRHAGAMATVNQPESLQLVIDQAGAAKVIWAGIAHVLGVLRGKRGAFYEILGEAIAAMLTRLGAYDSVLAWEERRMRREVRATANRLANFDDANLRRSARAAVAAGARVERALEILGSDAPDHLVMAGRLRVANRQASLEELGQLADPPLTKDAIAGRIRRLLAMADKRARDLGVPGTEAQLTPDMLMP